MKGYKMERITRKMLDGKIAFINKEHGLNLNVGYAYGGSRLESNNGSIDISCRGTKADVYYQLRAVQEVLHIKKNL